MFLASFEIIESIKFQRCTEFYVELCFFKYKNRNFNKIYNCGNLIVNAVETLNSYYIFMYFITNFYYRL